jgi:hypothetical protein
VTPSTVKNLLRYYLRDTLKATGLVTYLPNHVLNSNTECLLFFVVFFVVFLLFFVLTRIPIRKIAEEIIVFLKKNAISQKLWHVYTKYIYDPFIHPRPAG